MLEDVGPLPPLAVLASGLRQVQPEVKQCGPQPPDFGYDFGFDGCWGSLACGFAVRDR